MIDGLLHPPDDVLRPLTGEMVAVLGYGNQGEAHALNLRDSGVRVVVGARASSAGWRRAAEAGFDVRSLGEATAEARLAIMALPDEAQPEIFQASIKPALQPDAVIGFIHGFNVHYEFIRPPQRVGVVMVAPKGPGRTLRERYLKRAPLPCLFAVHRNRHDAEAVGLAWAAGIGCGEAILQTTFAIETETDLFGEQAVLCGGLSGLIQASFQTLVDAGYPPEIAYLECCHEVKQVADLIYVGGLAGMSKAISSTAEFGMHHAAPRVVDDALRERLRDLLGDIRDGTFARSFRQKDESTENELRQRRHRIAEGDLERAGQRVRRLALGERKEAAP